jgi:hypothetical protein
MTAPEEIGTGKHTEEQTQYSDHRFSDRSVFFSTHRFPLFQSKEPQEKGQKHENVEHFFLPFFAPNKIVNHQKGNCPG